MEVSIVGIYDQAINRYVQTMPFENSRVAEMSLKSAFLKGLIKIPNLPDYPNLFDVYEIASFDDKTGQYCNFSERRLVFNFGDSVDDKKKETEPVK